ncbi:vegetative cell wall protein gp1-like [Mesocricetus auratus]|uniref:Vegetative cell wall protein gp1-like n=1 Tax=Mesocricetus auratus TaxID=10036 RepID=A0ABM2WSF4_MESAU|nr:vegetative cell wall protein gp1-like [Mesocricetus auratus]XP_040593682.1 vegetative cell wall protein gp1-like [Mesocricetus auratus]
MTSPQRAAARGGLSPPRLRLRPRPQYRAQQPPLSWPPSPSPRLERPAPFSPRAGHAHGHAPAASRPRAPAPSSRAGGWRCGASSGSGCTSVSLADRSGRRPMLPAAPRPAPLWPPEGVASSRLPRGRAGPVIPAPPTPPRGLRKEPAEGSPTLSARWSFGSPACGWRRR